MRDDLLPNRRADRGGKVKLLVRENFRIEVYPDLWIRKTDDAKIEYCNLIKREIHRHIDGVDGALVQWDTKEICEFCKSEWEVDETGEPVCCTKAQDEWNNKVTAIKESK